MLANLDNEIYFRHIFSDSIVFNGFVKDILGISATFSKIEPAKKFKPKVGYIDFELDLFAESDDERVIIEIQKIVYDYNFDRFLHYFLMTIGELQKTYKDYKIQKTVYGIVVITEPYKVLPNGNPLRDEVLITNLNPQTLKKKEVELFGHQLVFLNPNYRNEQTPQSIKDWLDLFYESIHNPQKAQLNKNNHAIKRAELLGDMDKLNPNIVNKAKQKESALIKAKMLRDEVEEQKKQKEEALKREKEALTREEEALAKEKEERRQKEEALAKEKEALTREEEALAKEKEKSIKLAKKMLKYKEPIEEIMEETNLSREEIEKIDSDK